MKCPQCEDITLESCELGHVQVEQCPSCKGIWFNRDELRQAKDEIDPDLAWLDFEIWQHPDHFEPVESPHQCPACEADMVGVSYGETNVKIDYCEHCQGTWLDNGEFEKIILSLEEELEKRTLTDYIKDSIREAVHIITGPESLADEWKDFSTVLRLLQYRIFVENPKLLNTVINVNRHNPLP